MSELCHRCQRELPGSASRPAGSGLGPALSTLDEEAVLFCPRCGAPQLRLPEHLRNAASQPVTSTTGAPPPPRSAAFNAPRARLIDWPVAIRSAGLIALVEVLLILVVGLVPSETVRALAQSACLLLLFSAALLAVNLYARLAPQARLSGPAGLRIGLVAALLLIAICAPALGLTGVLSRFLFHSMTAVDDAWTETLRSMQLSFAASAHSAEETRSAQQILLPLHSPEGHGGAILASFAFYSIFLLLFSAASGAFAGMLRGPGRGVRQPQ